MIRSISHVALRVADVEEAEAHYSGLFELEVAFRDLEVEGVQQSLRPGVSWADARVAGHAPGLSALHREGFFLALEQVADPGGGRLDHVGLDVDPGELEAQEGRNEIHGCRLVAKRDDLLLFVDRYGLRWELTTTKYDRVADQSTGARLGRWLDLD